MASEPEGLVSKEAVRGGAGASARARGVGKQEPCQPKPIISCTRFDGPAHNCSEDLTARNCSEDLTQARTMPTARLGPCGQDPMLGGYRRGAYGSTLLTLLTLWFRVVQTPGAVHFCYSKLRAGRPAPAGAAGARHFWYSKLRPSADTCLVSPCR